MAFPPELMHSDSMRKPVFLRNKKLIVSCGVNTQLINTFVLFIQTLKFLVLFMPFEISSSLVCMCRFSHEGTHLISDIQR